MIGALALALLVAPGGDEPAPRTAVTVLALPHEEVPEETADKLLRALARGLTHNPHLDVKDAAKLMADFSGDVPTDEVEGARELAKTGQDLLANMQTKEAIGKLGEAVKRLEAVL